MTNRGGRGVLTATTVAFVVAGAACGGGSSPGGMAGAAGTAGAAGAAGTVVPSGAIVLAAAEDRTLAIAKGGKLYAWGELDPIAPTPREIVGGPPAWTLIATGREGPYLGAGTDGTLYAWEELASSAPIAIATPGATGPWLSVTVDSGAALAVDGAGALWGFGDNGQGQVGTGGTSPVSTPTLVPFPAGVTGWTKVESRWGTTLALTNDGRLFGWGQNDGAIDGTPTGMGILPTALPLPPGVTAWKDFAVGQGYAGAIDTTGRLFTWGINASGQLGTGDRTAHPGPNFLDTGFVGPYGQEATARYTAISMLSAQTLALLTDGRPVFFGNTNGCAQGQSFGSRPNVQNSPPLDTLTFATLAQGLGFSVLATADGRIFSYGKNDPAGTLGRGAPQFATCETLQPGEVTLP